MKGLYALDHTSFSLIYGPDEQRDIASRVDIESKPWSIKELRSNHSILQDIDLISEMPE
jgi:hypothetical protein